MAFPPCCQWALCQECGGLDCEVGHGEGPIVSHVFWKYLYYHHLSGPLTCPSLLELGLDPALLGAAPCLLSGCTELFTQHL